MKVDMLLKQRNQTKPYLKGSFWDALTNGILTGISEVNGMGTILKKINVSFIVHFCLCKYSFSLDTFWKTSFIYTYTFVEQKKKIDIKV